MTLVESLTKIKEHLSDKETWETNWENNRIIGYASGSLSNDLGGLYSQENKKHYRPAYDCVARAIVSLCGPIKESRPVIFGKGHLLDEEYMKYCPEEKDIRTLRAFEEYKDHGLLMKVLDTSIKYAKLYVFS